MVLSRTARRQRGADERRDDAYGSGFRCFGRAAQAARGDRGRRQQPDEARAPGADRPSGGRRLGNDGGHGRDRLGEGDGVALAGAVHAGGRGRPSARQDAPAGQAPDVRGEGPRGGGAGAELRAGGGDALDGARLVAEKVGLSPTTVHKILVRHRLAPHKVRRFKVSTDPHFAEKTREVIGLYMNPPDHAVVLSIDEKTQIQALGRTQKGLPMKPGRPATMTHEDKRNGTTTLFAATDILDGTVIGRHSERHRRQEFIAFLEQVDKAAPAGRKIHAIVDNDSAHKHSAVADWLADHPALDPPLHADLLLLDERGRGLLREAGQPPAPARRPRFPRGSQGGGRRSFIELHNGKEAKPFKWTASPDRLIAARQRGFQMIQTSH